MWSGLVRQLIETVVGLVLDECLYSTRSMDCKKITVELIFNFTLTSMTEKDLIVSNTSDMELTLFKSCYKLFLSQCSLQLQVISLYPTYD